MTRSFSGNYGKLRFEQLLQFYNDGVKINHKINIRFGNYTRLQHPFLNKSIIDMNLLICVHF